MEYITKLEEESNFTQTENGALTYKSSTNALIDFFSLGGAYRNRSETDLISLFSRAMSENNNDAIKVLFYLRDIRGGQGERKIFRTILNHLGNNYKLSEPIKFFDWVYEYGRYDDLFSFIGTKYEKEMFTELRKQFIYDLTAEHPSILAKWLKSENTSSKKSVEIAKLTMKYFEMSPKIYRKNLVIIRNKLKIIEHNLSNKNYKGINYSNIPSKAMLQYRNAFLRNDEIRYTNYLENVKNKESKINTSTLYPYEIVEKVFSNRKNEESLNLLWDNQKDWVVDNGNNIVVADVSGSMEGRPLAVSISLAMYLAERNKGFFKDYFITFSNTPNFDKIHGNNLFEKVMNLNKAHWGSNTNLQAVFDLILNVAIKYNISQNEMLKNIYIVSDMEFDLACANTSTNFEVIKQKYISKGYEMPNLIFWNVDARQNQSPVKFNENGVMLVSGCSPSIFQQTLSKTNPYDFMRQIIDGERYKKIHL